MSDNEKMTFEATFKAVEPDVVRGLATPPTAMMIGRDYEVPPPRRPEPQRGIIAWVTRANAKAEREYEAAYERWEASDKKGTTWVYMPNVEFVEMSPDAD